MPPHEEVIHEITNADLWSKFANECDENANIDSANTPRIRKPRMMIKT